MPDIEAYTENAGWKKFTQLHLIHQQVKYLNSLLSKYFCFCWCSRSAPLLVFPYKWEQVVTNKFDYLNVHAMHVFVLHFF
jgi:hypothetical protein